MYYLLLTSMCLGGWLIFSGAATVHTKTWVNPVSLYLLNWLLLVFLYKINLLSYIDIDLKTWILIFCSVFAFITGVFIPWLIADRKDADCKQKTRKDILSLVISKKRIKFSIYALFVAGSVVFLFYLYNVTKNFGVQQIFNQLNSLRAFMKTEGTLLGFHYFYIYEMVLPMVVVFGLLYGFRRNYLLVFVGIIATIALLLTAAKVNIFKSLIWSFWLIVLLNIEKLTFQRLVCLAFTLFTFGVILFIVITDFSGELSGLDKQLREVYARHSAQIPVFEKFINDPNVKFEFGKLIILPIVKVIAVFSHIDAPSHIMPFYNVPVRFNLGTYLQAMYRDFGLIGIVFMPWFFGLLCGYFFYKFLIYKDSFWLAYLNSIFFMWIFASTSTAGYLKPVYWFQLILGFLICRFITTHSSNVSDDNFIR